MSQNQFPKLHNAMWPGLVGKGPDSEPPIDLDTMLDLTARASVHGVRFDGVDLFLFDPHVSIDSDDDDLKRLAEKVRTKGFVVGSVVAPVWPPTGGGSAMGGTEERQKFVQQVRKACRIAARLRELGVRPYGVVRIDSACSPADWAKQPDDNTRLIARTFSEACDVAENYGERLAAEGEICWGGMHSWREMVKLLKAVNRPKTLGFQADMAHTLLYTLGYNSPGDRILPQGFNWDEPEELNDALRKLTAALRPWTIDFHVAQNDATVKGSGSHDKTGRHCLPNDPNGKLKIAEHAGFWMRNDRGQVTKAFQHICWDGCMFPNATMMKQQTWNDILSVMVAVREAHGWNAASRSAKPSGNSAPIVVRGKLKRTTAASSTPKHSTAKAPPANAAKARKAKAKKAAKPAVKRPLKAKVKAKAKKPTAPKKARRTGKTRRR